MNEITLNTMDGEVVSFVGDLVCQAEGCVEFSDGIDRNFGLKLYAIASGGFVPSIEYFSNSPMERTGCIAEIVDLAKDIENFFFVFTPEELLPDSAGLAQEEVETRTRLLNCLRKNYESLNFDFLDQVEAVVSEQAITEGEQATAKPQANESESSSLGK